MFYLSFLKQQAINNSFSIYEKIVLYLYFYLHPQIRRPGIREVMYLYEGFTNSGFSNFKPQKLGQWPELSVLFEWVRILRRCKQAKWDKGVNPETSKEVRFSDIVIRRNVLKLCIIRPCLKDISTQRWQCLLTIPNYILRNSRFFKKAMKFTHWNKIN